MTELNQLHCQTFLKNTYKTIRLSEDQKREKRPQGIGTGRGSMHCILELKRNNFAIPAVAAGLKCSKGLFLTIEQIILS